ncbi:hypothetical protein [Deinococcus sp.]|uniref:hypothetical protein n=1 Tax=Deinococcus sp. TaxID=47478 RepID=UPI003CC5DB1F
MQPEGIIRTASFVLAFFVALIFTSANAAAHLKIRTPLIEQYRLQSEGRTPSFRISVLNEGNVALDLQASISSSYGVVSARLTPSRVAANSVSEVTVKLLQITLGGRSRALSAPDEPDKFSGTLILQGSLSSTGERLAVSEVASLPITLFAPSAALFNRPVLPASGVGVALTLIGLTVLRLRAGTPRLWLGSRMVEASFDPAKSWVSNLTLFTALVTGLLSGLTLPSASKLMYISMAAFFASFIPIAPLLYKATLNEVIRKETSSKLKVLRGDRLLLSVVQPPASERVAAGPIWGYLLASLFTLAANLGIIGLLLLLINELGSNLASFKLGTDPVILFITLIVLFTLFALYATWATIYDTVTHNHRDYLRLGDQDPDAVQEVAAQPQDAAKASQRMRPRSSGLL